MSQFSIIDYLQQMFLMIIACLFVISTLQMYYQDGVSTVKYIDSTVKNIPSNLTVNIMGFNETLLNVNQPIIEFRDRTEKRNLNYQPIQYILFFYVIPLIIFCHMFLIFLNLSITEKFINYIKLKYLR